MKQITFILLFLLSVTSWSQDIKPITPLFKPLQSPSFSYHIGTERVWIYKGNVYGWTELASFTGLKDTLNYYVPYQNADQDVDLNTHSILAKGQRLPLFNGACIIPTILDNGDGSLTVGEGEYHLSKNPEGKGTSNYIIPGGIFSLTDNTTNYLVADYNNGSPILRVITDVSLINETTVVPVYTAYRSGTILNFQNWDALGVALANKVHQSIVKTQRYRREPGGLIISELPTRIISLTSGRVWVGAVPVDLASIVSSTDNLRIFYHSGGVWINTSQTQYNNLNYDNGTNLVELTSNRYAVNWVYRGIENQKHLYLTLGKGDYTLAQAQEAQPPTPPIAISSHAMLVGKIIIQKGASSATSVQSAFDVTFTTSSASVHNDLTGRDAIDTHPSTSIGYIPYSDINETNVGDAINYLADSRWSKAEITPQDTTRWGLGGGGSGGGTPVMAFANRIPISTQTVNVSWPSNFANTNYFLHVFPYYIENIEGKSVRIQNAVYDFTKTVAGFSLKVDTVAGFLEYFAADTLQVLPTGNLVLKSDSLTTFVTPKQLNDSLNTIVLTETDPIYSASSWPGTTNNSAIWDKGLYTDNVNSSINYFLKTADTSRKAIQSSLFEDAGGNIKVSGNLGVNITATSRLHIVDGTVAELKFNSGISSLTPSLSVGNTGASGKFAGLIAGTAGAVFEYDAAGYFAISSNSKTNYTNGTLGGGTRRFLINSSGQAYFGSSTAPTAWLHIQAGLATAGFAPLKFTSGTNLTNPEAGAVEFDGSRLYFTPSTTRKTLSFDENFKTFNGSSIIGSGDFTLSNSIIKFDTGTTEGTDLYTYNGSSSKTIDIKAGTNITLTKAANSITINSSGGSSNPLGAFGIQEGFISPGLAGSLNGFTGLFAGLSYSGTLTAQSGTDSPYYRFAPGGFYQDPMGFFTGTTYGLTVNSKPILFFRFSRQTSTPYHYLKIGLSSEGTSNTGYSSSQSNIVLKYNTGTDTNLKFAISNGTNETIYDTGVNWGSEILTFVIDASNSSSIVLRLLNDSGTELSSTTITNHIPTVKLGVCFKMYDYAYGSSYSFYLYGCKLITQL